MLTPYTRKPLGNPNPNASNLALGIILFLVLIVQTVFNAWQDFSTSRVMASIKGMLPSDVLVLRDSVSTMVAAKDLVPGDLVSINMGNKVPADLRLIEASSDLQFDRSILTGEVRAWFLYVSCFGLISHSERTGLESYLHDGPKLLRGSIQKKDYRP